MANPFMRATITIRDNASAAIARITQNHNRLNASMRAGQKISAAVNTQARTTALAIQSNVKATRAHNAAVREENKQMKRRSITWLGMLKVMGLFALNLQIIRAASSPFTFLSGAISVAKDFEFGLSQINVLLRLSKPAIEDFGLSLRRLGGELGIATEDLLTAAKQIASSISSLNIGQLSEAEAALQLLRQAARGAVVDNSDLTSSVLAIQVVLAALRIPVERAESVMKILFATVDVGDTSFAKLGQNIGTFASTLAAVLPRDTERQFDFLLETFTLLAGLTQVMSTSEASTSINRFFQNFIKQAEGQKDVIREIQDLTGADLSLQNLIAEGPIEFFKNINKAIGVDSPIISGLRAKIAEGRELTENDLAAFEQATNAKLASLIAPNIRALKPVLLLGQPGLIEQLFIDMVVSIDKFDQAQEEALSNFAITLKRLSTIWDALKISLADPLIKEAVKPLKNIADALNDVVNAVGFDQLSAGNKISKALDTVVFEMNTWWNTGGSKKVDDFTNTFVDGIIIFLQKAIFDNTDKFIEIGESIAKGVFKGLIDAAKDPSVLKKLAPTLALSALGVSPGRAIAGGFFANQSISALTDEGGLSGGGLLEGLLFASLGASAVKGAGGLVLGGFRGLGGSGVGASGGPATRSTLASAIRGGARTFGPTAAIIGGGTLRARAGFLTRTLGVSGIATLARRASIVGLGSELAARAGGFNGIFDFIGQLGGNTGDANAQGQAIGAASGASGLGAAFAALGVSETRLAELNAASTAPGGFSAGGVSLGGFLSNAKFTAGTLGGLLSTSIFDTAPSGTTGSIFGFGNFPSGTALNKQKDIARGSIEGIERKVFASLGLPYDVFKGQLSPLLAIARNAGLTDSSEQIAFLAAVASIAKNENGRFDPNIIVNDPTLLDSSAKSIGLLQLNTAGKGFGRSISDLQNIGTNLHIGGISIASTLNRLIRSGQTPNDPNFFQNVAIGAGFPTTLGTVEGLSNAQLDHIADIQTQGFINFQSLSNNPFGAIDSGGTTNSQGNLSVSVAGDFIVKLDDVEILNALTEAIADELAIRGLVPSDLSLSGAIE